MTLTSVDMSSVRLIGNDNISSEKRRKNNQFSSRF